MPYDNGMQDLSDRQIAEETLGRLRRIETKTTKVANHLGVDAGGDKPVFYAVGHILQVPSRKTSLDDIIAAVPEKHRSMVKIMCGDDYLATISV